MSLADRKQCIALVKEADQSGAGRGVSCQILELSLRTLERWEKSPDQGDQRSGPKTLASHALTDQEKKSMIAISTSGAYRDLSPWKIVAKLADSGSYLASESSFYRVLKKEKLLRHHLRSKPKEQRPPKDLVARKSNEVWSWDITYLKAAIRGTHYYLYLIEDIFSRMIVGWKVERVENADQAARLIAEACSVHGIQKNQLTLHSDNGGPMKGASMLSTLQKLGVIPSFSRPSVSDDNPFSESLFKTLKYCPSYPDGSFAGIEEASEWVNRFVTWYNHEHLHSGIRFVTPHSRHYGEDTQILKDRKIVYEEAKRRNPHRWSRQTRNWTRIMEVHLNPKKETKKQNKKLTIQAA